MNVELSDLQQLLEWQVNSCESGEASELRQLLQNNRDQYARQVEYVEQEIAEKRWRKDFADDYLYIRAWHAVRSGLTSILKATERKTLLEPVRINYRNRRDGTALEIPEVDVDKRARDLIRAHENKLQDICSAKYDGECLPVTK